MSAGLMVLAPSPGPGTMAVMEQACERCPVCGHAALAEHELCRACLAAFAPTIARGRQAGERWWVLAAIDPGPLALHVPALAELDALAWGEGALLLASVATGCGARVLAGRANAYTGRLIERCAPCSAVAGYPTGMGPPQRDSTCTTRLAQRLVEVW